MGYGEDLNGIPNPSEGAGRGWRRWFRYLRLYRDPNIPKLELKLIRQMWELTKPYWVRPGAWVSYVILTIYIAYELEITVIAAKVAKFSGDQLMALSKHNSATFYDTVVLTIVANIGLIVLGFLCGLPYKIMLDRWRQWLTRKYLSDYLSNKNYYTLNRDRTLDNPDERIANDIASFVIFPSSVLLSFVRCIFTVAVFGHILASYGWYLIWCCAGYYAVYSVVSLFVSRPLMNLEYVQKRMDGDFRFSLVNVRVNAEPIAFLRGEQVEEKELHHRLDQLVDNTIRTSWWSRLLTSWLSFSNDLSTVLPALLVAPLVLHGKMNLSSFTQALVAWGRMGSAFGFVGQESLTFALSGAMIARVYALHQYCIGHVRDPSPLPQIRHIASDRIAVERFSLFTPDGSRVLVQDLDFDLERGKSLVVTGHNGSGKSSLLRGFAGLWTCGTGEVYLPPRESMMFMPQQPYMSLGTFREQVTYPELQRSFQDEEIQRVLASVQLGHLEERFGGMDAKLDWSNVLSPGEQQRIAFARTLLRRSEFVLLDEATSAIDPEAEQLLYALLQQMGSTYISVAHRTAVFPFHQRQLVLTGDGRWSLSVIDHAISASLPDISSL